MAENNQEIKLVEDMVMSPTYTKDVASLIKNILEKSVPFGIYHLNNSGRCSWYEFAKEIFKIINLNPNTMKIKSKDLVRTAKRPLFSVLDNRKIISLGFDVNDWKIGLRNYLFEKGYR
jgi:dTDP-4-dehydrorhamnose reductase